MDYIEISTFGNALDFGDLNNLLGDKSASGCSTSPEWHSLQVMIIPIQHGNILRTFRCRYNMASKGDAVDFGTLLKEILVHVDNASKRDVLLENMLPINTTSGDAQFLMTVISLSQFGNSVDFGELHHLV